MLKTIEEKIKGMYQSAKKVMTKPAFLITAGIVIPLATGTAAIALAKEEPLKISYTFYDMDQDGLYESMLTEKHRGDKKIGKTELIRAPPGEYTTHGLSRQELERRIDILQDKREHIIYESKYIQGVK